MGIMLTEGWAKQSDADLVGAARDGDKHAFCRLVDRHMPMFEALCRQVLGGAHSTEDVVQESVLQAMLNLDRLRQPSSFGPWLAGIALNLSRRIVRRQQRDGFSWEALMGGGARVAIDPGESPEELALSADLSRQVGQAIDALPSGQREAVTAFYLAGLTCSEAAELLRVDARAVKSRLHRARSALRRRLWSTWKEELMSTRADGVDVRIVDVRRRSLAVECRRYNMVLLEEIGGRRRLPIWVGEDEGAAIALLMEQVEVPRPLTFKFMGEIVRAMGGRLHEVRLEKLIEGTFYAVAEIGTEAGVRAIDGRPSDAFALALEFGAPIRVNPEVFEAAEMHMAAHEHVPPAEAYYGEGTLGATQIVEEVKSSWPGFGSGAGSSR